jgi:hypothetical protein
VPVVLSRSDQVVRLALKQGRRTDLATLVVKEKASAARGPAGLRAKLGMAPTAVTGPVLPTDPRTEFFQFGNVAYAPVVETVSEGITASALAIVSADRRFVRLNISAQFSDLIDVFRFSFINNGNPTGNPGPGQ